MCMCASKLLSVSPGGCLSVSGPGLTHALPCEFNAPVGERLQLGHSMGGQVATASCCSNSL